MLENTCGKLNAWTKLSVAAYLINDIGMMNKAISSNKITNRAIHIENTLKYASPAGIARKINITRENMHC